LKIPTAQTLVAMLLLCACGKPVRPPYDFKKVAAKLKVGMTKAEVITAIGAPDKDSETDPELSKNSKPGTFVLFYEDGLLKHFFVRFREGKLEKVMDTSAPAGIVPPP